MKSTYTSSVERGILTSTYKREIRESVATSKNTSLSKIKSLMVNNDRLESQTGTILRVSLFAIAIVMISF